MVVLPVCLGTKQQIHTSFKEGNPDPGFPSFLFKGQFPGTGCTYLISGQQYKIEVQFGYAGRGFDYIGQTRFLSIFILNIII